MAEADKFYSQAKSQLDIEEFRDPYYSEMQVLYDQEHGSNDPSRLIFFNELLKAKDRSEETDQDILVPWLIRYVWVTQYPNYTQGAVRLLLGLPLDDALITVITSDILQNHPHGLARAAVIEPSEAYRPWFEDQAFLSIVKDLPLTDPHPDVRRNAMGLLYDVRYPVDQIIDALKSDPAAEVRALWAAQLKGQIDDPERSEPILRNALFAPQNISVAPEMMLTYLSSGTVKADLQRLSQGLNFLAAHSDHPQMPQLLDAMEWQTDKVAVPSLLKGAPYADGSALRTWLLGAFTDATAPLIQRGYALKTLAAQDNEDLEPQAIADFMLHADHTNDSLHPLFNLSLGSRVLRQLFQTWPKSVVSQAETQKELIQILLAHYSEPGADGEPRTGSAVQDGLLFELQRLYRLMQAPEDSEWLTDRLLSHAATSATDLTYGVSQLLEDRDVVPDEAFLNYATQKVSGFSGSLSSTFIDRLRPGPWEDPAINPGDLTLAIKLIELSQQRNPDKPDDAYQDVYDLIYQLPTKAEMPDGLPDLGDFEAKLRDMQTQAEREDGYWAIRNWLGED